MAEIKDFARMCNAQNACTSCQIGKLRKGTTCARFLYEHTDEADRIITDWCDEHPQKTYAKDFFDKFPDATKKSDGSHMPSACDIYGKLDCFRKHCSIVDDCVSCWNEVMPDA